MLSGGNLARIVAGLCQGAESNPLTPIPPANLSAGLKATLGLDLEEDLLPWMGSEFSLALVPASPGSHTSGKPAVYAVGGWCGVDGGQASDRSLAEKSLQQLDEVMATRYRFQVEQTELGGQPVISWTSELGGL
jgi:hypothetical protein